MKTKNETTICTMLITAMMIGMCAHGTTYDVASQWDSVSSESYADGTGNLTAANGWSTADGVASVSNGVIYVTATNNDVFCYSPSCPVATNDCQSVYVHVDNLGLIAKQESLSNVQAALATDFDAYYVCSGGSWIAMTGSTPSEGACDIRVDFSNSVGKVRYAVKLAGADDYTVLTTADGGEEWIANGATAQPASRVDFKGRGAFSKISFTQIGTVTASDTFAERMKAQGVSADDLNDTADNGNLNWENIVLGLDGTDISSQPVVQPVQSAKTDTVTLALGGVDVDATSGASVKYTVVSSDTIGGAGTESAVVSYNERTEVALPSSGVRYYRMKVVATPNN